MALIFWVCPVYTLNTYYKDGTSTLPRTVPIAKSIQTVFDSVKD